MIPSKRRSQKWRELPPVEQPVSIVDEEGIENRTVAVTFLRTHDRCDRAAYLDLLHEGGVGSHAMNRGSLGHIAFAKCISHVIEHDEHQVTPETAKDLLLEASAENPDLAVPAHERDSLRAMMHNFAEGTYFTPETIIGVEVTLQLQLGEWLIRGRVDLAEMPHFGRVDVTDYKTAFAMVTEGEWRGDFQTYLYALLLAYGEMADGGACLAPAAEEFHLKLVYPRYLRDDGLATREVVITRQQLLDFRLDLEAQLTRLGGQLESQKWPATPGSHCSECPSPVECPLPRHLRPDSQMAVGSIDDVQKLAEWWFVQDARVKRAKARIKAWANEHGRQSIPIGTDRELAFIEREEFVSLDREEHLIAVEGAVEYGTPIDTEKLRQKRTSSRFEERKIKKEDDDG